MPTLSESDKSDRRHLAEQARIDYAEAGREQIRLI
jgi:hypothetical protein